MRCYFKSTAFNVLTKENTGQVDYANNTEGGHLAKLNFSSKPHLIITASRAACGAYFRGVDEVSARSFEHGWDWIEIRLLAHAQISAIAVAACAVKSNHLHVVLRKIDRSNLAQTVA